VWSHDWNLDRDYSSDRSEHSPRDASKFIKWFAVRHAAITVRLVRQFFKRLADYYPSALPLALEQSLASFTTCLSEFNAKKKGYVRSNDPHVQSRAEE
jgi:hypothetical protein